MDAGLSTPWQCSVVIGLKSHTCLAGALNGLAARAARRSAVLTGLTAAFFESSLSEVPALNVSLREANSICSTSGIGRSATDMLLRTGHSARRTRDRRHPANLDPLRSVASGGFAVIEPLT